LQIEPWAYLKDVLTRLPRSQGADLAELPPDRWQAARRQAASTSTGRSTAPDPAP
jgi:hypothetical protein